MNSQSGNDESNSGGDSTSFIFSTDPHYSTESAEGKRSIHSCNTSYGVESLPKVFAYRKWCKGFVKDDEKWVEAVKQFNDKWPVHRRMTKPARLVRRILVPMHRVGWAKAAREVYKRQDIEWELEEKKKESDESGGWTEEEEEDENSISSADMSTMSPVTDSLDATSSEEGSRSVSED